ncbi:MAG: hypothetical protein ACODUE_06615 [Synechococcus sp.]
MSVPLWFGLAAVALAGLPGPVLLDGDNDRVLALEPPVEAPPGLVWTLRESLSGPQRWRVAYEIDCPGRRLRRVSQPLALAPGLDPRAEAVPPVLPAPTGEDGDWLPERPFTLAAQLLQRHCPAAG